MQPALPNFRQMMLDQYAGKDPGGVIWQPRIDFWYEYNKKRGTLPPHVAKMTLMELYDYCHASSRYFNFPLRLRYNENVKITTHWVDDKNLHRDWHTPVGTLTDTLHYDELRLSGYNSEYLLKTAADFEVYTYILRNEVWEWDDKAFEENERMAGNRGVTQFFSRRTPIQHLFIDAMGFENTVFFMTDHPEVVDRYIEAQTEADDLMYDLICAHRFPIFNLGDNIDYHMDSPTIWRKYLMPNYIRRTQQLHAAGIHTSIHVDGSMKRLLKDLANCPTEAIEACTPLPQGDVTLEEIKTALGDRILQDGIPAIFFLPIYPLEDLVECTKKVVALFHPRLNLGVSDELPPDSDIERVRLVGEMVQKMA